MSGDNPRSLTPPEERYIVRVQLIRSDKEGEYISQSFDYEVTPNQPHHGPLFMRAERFYKQIQASFKRSGGKVTVTPSYA